jgi:hypothetical protein
VLKSLGAFGWVEFHAAASPAVNKTNAGAAAGSAANDPATMAAVMQRPPTHGSFRFIIDLG